MISGACSQAAEVYHRRALQACMRLHFISYYFCTGMSPRLRLRVSLDRQWHNYNANLLIERTGHYPVLP